MKHFKPPTIEEVRAYIIEKKLFSVDAQEFIDYFEDGEPKWHDSTGKPVRSWKQKLRTWHSFALKRGEPQHKCFCGLYGVYTGTDDTGQRYWLCEKHKPGFKAKLPTELTQNALKDAKEEPINEGLRRTELIEGLQAAK